ETFAKPQHCHCERSEAISKHIDNPQDCHVALLLAMTKIEQKWGLCKGLLLGRKKEEREKGDERILGSGDFVAQALKRANELHERSIKSRISLNELIKRVSKDRNIDLKDLISSKRKKDISNTRAIISYLAAIELRHSGAKIASELRLSEKSVSRCIERGKKLLLCRLPRRSGRSYWG
ncbi:MAG: hypothetical protein KAU60_01590, partial [Desulfobacterales bacterium]|nr:hypothetical protein [Desulfobacterales bacterium]